MAEQDLINLIESGFKDVGQKIADLSQDVGQKIADLGQRIAAVEAEVRHLHVSVEALRGDVKLVSEGVSNVEEKLDRHNAENARQFEDIERHFETVHSAIRTSRLRDDNLDARVTALETSRR